jgi:hypothetical protein
LYVNISPLSDTTFSWVYTTQDTPQVYWGGYAFGKNRSGGDMVSSPEDTSNCVPIQLTVFLRSDADADMDVEMSDAVFTLRYLYVPGAEQPLCMDGADSDDGGVIEMSDAIFTLKYLYVPGSPLPPAPGPVECGHDPTEDDLDCADHPCMGR